MPKDLREFFQNVRIKSSTIIVGQYFVDYHKVLYDLNQSIFSVRHVIREVSKFCEILTTF